MDVPIPEILDHRRDADEENLNALDNGLEGDSPFFTNYAAMHNMVALLKGQSYVLSCPSDGKCSLYIFKNRCHRFELYDYCKHYHHYRLFSIHC